MLYLCDNQALLKAVKRWVGEGGKATLVAQQVQERKNEYDSDHIFQVQFNLLFRVSALFQGGVGRAIREDGVLLKLDFFEDKVWSE